MARYDEKYSFVHDETNTVYHVVDDFPGDRYRVCADTQLRNGKIMRLNFMVDRYQASQAMFDDGPASRDPKHAALQMGFLRLRPEVMKKLDELEERDMIQHHFADDKIDAAVAREKEIRLKREAEDRAEAARRKQEEADREREELESIPGWGEF